MDGSRATITSVLSAMEKHSWIHLACHAKQDAKNPTESGFRLHDGILSLAMITNKTFQGKDLAFLSACETATGDEKLPDEAIHLAAGMLMAGYRSVIATMWSIKDQDAPLVAEKVYAKLLKDGKLDSTGVARGLHSAVGHLRAKVGEEAFERWVPYIHIGV
jgi:CHAT domain-containing protein